MCLVNQLSEATGFFLQHTLHFVSTHHSDDLREFEPHFDGESVGAVGDRSDEPVDKSTVVRVKSIIETLFALPKFQ